MNILILVKHSQPAIVPAIPASRWGLSKPGRFRCIALAEKLESFLPDTIVSSVEPKAVETAQAIAHYLNKPFHTLEGLHEHDRTGVEFLDARQFETKVSSFFIQRGKLVFGKETADQAQERFTKALAFAKLDYPKQNIIVVSHGTVITLFVDKYNPLDAFSFWKELSLPSFVVLSLPHHKLVTTVKSVV